MVLASLLVTPVFAQDAARNALMLCKAMDNTGLGSQPCEVSGWSSTITIHVDMVSSEARNLCSMMQDYAKSSDFGFGGKWKLEIKSPYSGGQSIAYCMLP